MLRSALALGLLLAAAAAKDAKGLSGYVDGLRMLLFPFTGILPDFGNQRLPLGLAIVCLKPHCMMITFRSINFPVQFRTHPDLFGLSSDLPDSSGEFFAPTEPIPSAAEATADKDPVVGGLCRVNVAKLLPGPKRSQ